MLYEVITEFGDRIEQSRAEGVVEELRRHPGRPRAQLPAGYYLDAGGSWHESRTNEGAIQAVFPVMILVVLT